MKTGYVYILTNKPNGILYIGVTSNLAKRVYEHKQKIVDGFTKQYGLARLVYVEEYPTMEEAIHHEKCMKEWKRAWKVKRILEQNPEWNDLADELV
jgi:putative endonuclease